MTDSDSVGWSKKIMRRFAQFSFVLYILGSTFWFSLCHFQEAANFAAASLIAFI